LCLTKIWNYVYKCFCVARLPINLFCRTNNRRVRSVALPRAKRFPEKSLRNTQHIDKTAFVCSPQIIMQSADNTCAVLSNAVYYNGVLCITVDYNSLLPPPIPLFRFRYKYAMGECLCVLVLLDFINHCCLLVRTEENRTICSIAFGVVRLSMNQVFRVFVWRVLLTWSFIITRHLTLKTTSAHIQSLYCRHRTINIVLSVTTWRRKKKFDKTHTHTCTIGTFSL